MCIQVQFAVDAFQIIQSKGQGNLESIIQDAIRFAKYSTVRET